MRRALVLWWGLAAAPLAAQSAQQPPMFLFAHGDSVRLLLTEEPPAFGGFVVYRRLALAEEFTRLTPEPVRRVRQPAVAAGLIGADLPAVRQALRARDDGELLRRLQGDRFAAHVLSLLYPQVGVVLGRSFADGGLRRGASYEYRVVFTDNHGKETARQISRRVQVVDLQPPAPRAVQAAPGDGAVTVSWSHPRFAGDPDDLVIGFHVYRAAARGPAERITDRPVVRNDAGQMEFVDTLARNGVAYQYHVRSVDLARRESAPSPAAAALARDLTPPRTPGGLVAQPGDGVVTLSWPASSEVDVAGYHVERSTGLDQPFRRLTTTPVPAARPAYADRTAVGGTAYFYRVVAVDAAGNASHPGNAIAAVPVDHTPPAPPSRVTVRAVERRLEIRWAGSPSPDVKGYYVYRGDAPGRLVRLVQQPVTGPVFVDSGYGGAGLAPGGRYRLSVSAVDRSYNESEPVPAEIAVPDDEPPAPPTGFEVRNVLGRYVEAGWSASPAQDVRSYLLSRSSPGRPDTVIGQLPEGAVPIIRDTTAVPGIAYTYRLIAVDGAGNRSSAAVDTLVPRDPVGPPAPRFVSATLTPRGVQVSWERVVDDGLAGYHVYRALVPTGVFERLTTSPVTELRFLDPAGRAEHYYAVRAVDRSANESSAGPAVRGGAR